MYVYIYVYICIYIYVYIYYNIIEQSHYEISMLIYEQVVLRSDGAPQITLKAPRAGDLLQLKSEQFDGGYGVGVGVTSQQHDCTQLCIHFWFSTRPKWEKTTASTSNLVGSCENSRLEKGCMVLVDLPRWRRDLGSRVFEQCFKVLTSWHDFYSEVCPLKGWLFNPLNNGISPIYQLVREFATIHSIRKIFSHLAIFPKSLWYLKSVLRSWQVNNINMPPGYYRRLPRRTAAFYGWYFVKF